MACNPSYQLKLFDQLGNPLYDIEDYLEFTVERTKNEIGTLNIALPGATYNINDFKKDYRCEVWREGSLVGNTCWFLQRIDKTLNELCDSEFILTFSDSIELLSRRINANYSSDGFVSLGTLTAAADDIIKILFDFNYINVGVDNGIPPDYPVIINPNAGPPAAVPAAYNDAGLGHPGGRTMDVTYEAFRTDAPVVTTNSSFSQVLTAMQETASTAYITEDTANTNEYYNNVWFDFVYTPRSATQTEGFEFKTWTGIRGNDLRNVKFVGPDFLNLADPVYTDDWSNRADIAFVAGDGDHALQAVGQATLPTGMNSYYYSLPFGPIETVTAYDRSSTVTGDELDAEGAKALGRGVNTKQITGTIVNVEGFDFITDFNYGDFLSLSWGEIVETIEISSFTVTVTGDTETIDVPLSIIEKL